MHACLLPNVSKSLYLMYSATPQQILYCVVHHGISTASTGSLHCNCRRWSSYLFMCIILDKFLPHCLLFGVGKNVTSKVMTYAPETFYTYAYEYISIDINNRITSRPLWCSGVVSRRRQSKCGVHFNTEFISVMDLVRMCMYDTAFPAYIFWKSRTHLSARFVVFSLVYHRWNTSEFGGRLDTNLSITLDCPVIWKSAVSLVGKVAKLEGVGCILVCPVVVHVDV